MKVTKIMTKEPAACTPEMSLREVAHLMVEHDCGAIPVVENFETMKPVGIVTDRDIVVNTVAVGKDPLMMTAAEIMSFPPGFVTTDATVGECLKLMEKDMIRRMLVVNEENSLAGIVAQADVARHMREEKTAEFIKDVSMAHRA